MKAIILREPGGAEQLRVQEVPAPEPGPAEVLVALHAAALNRRDILVRSRPQMAEMMPLIPGAVGDWSSSSTAPFRSTRRAQLMIEWSNMNSLVRLF